MAVRVHVLHCPFVTRFRFFFEQTAADPRLVPEGTCSPETWGIPQQEPPTGLPELSGSAGTPAATGV